jgi:hypothetical protein
MVVLMGSDIDITALVRPDDIRHIEDILDQAAERRGYQGIKRWSVWFDGDRTFLSLNICGKKPLAIPTAERGVYPGYRDPEKRKAYMREYMRKRRAK